MQDAGLTWVANEGAAIRARASDLLPELGALATVTRLRGENPHVEPALISIACSVAQTALAHASKLGPRWTQLVLTDTLAQQATAWTVARYRALQALERGVRRVIDASAGAGMDSLAFADAGISVTSIERDPGAFSCLRANVPMAHAVLGDSRDEVPRLLASQDAAVFVDPARRDDGPRRVDGGRAHPERDPERWSPPWSWVRELATQAPVFAKVAPGIPAALLDGTSTEWIGLGPDLVEACAWFGNLRAGFVRRATVLGPDGAIDSIDDSQPVSPVIAQLDAYLIEPHAAVLRAGLVETLAARHDVGRVTLASSWLTGPTPVGTGLARSWRVERTVPTGDLRETLADYSSVVYKTSDIGRAAEAVAAGIRHRPAKHATGTAFVVLMRDLEVAALVQPESAQ